MVKLEAGKRIDSDELEMEKTLPLLLRAIILIYGKRIMNGFVFCTKWICMVVQGNEVYYTSTDFLLRETNILFKFAGTKKS